MMLALQIVLLMMLVISFMGSIGSRKEEERNRMSHVFMVSLISILLTMFVF